MRNCAAMMEGTALERIAHGTSDSNQRNRGGATLSMTGLLFAAVLLFVSFPTVWWATDRLESNDDFCNACHLPTGIRLHTEIRADFDERPAPNLAAQHAAASLATRPDSPAIRCIDCHGGVGFAGRARVKLLSVKDSILYVTGQFDEPTEMSWPLLDADCRQCHAQFQKKTRGFDGSAFHDKPLHNTGLGVDCVECHTAHATTGDAENWFLTARTVRSRCGQCHIEYTTP